jgi:hypothetical protein
LSGVGQTGIAPEGFIVVRFEQVEGGVRSRIQAKHQINWQEILPLTAIAKSQNDKIRRFREQQLEQGYRKSKGISI